MRLISATVRNYRIHRDQTVTFDPQRTLIGGPNECGKSTFAEAVHAALFLRAKITGEAQQRMVSRDGGNPEVEVFFEAGGAHYSLQKRFYGAKGTVTLTEQGGQSWTSDEAEEKLAKLLHVEAPVGGKGAADKAAQQWAHLWAWQGQAGEDPSVHANAQRDALLARLKTEGGAAAMQSILDGDVAAQFAVLTGQLFAKNDSPRAGSDLAEALQALKNATQAETDARVAWDRLQLASESFEQATAEIGACGETEATLASEKSDVELRLARVSKLRLDEATQVGEANAARERYESLGSADLHIKECRKEILDRGQLIAPKARVVEQLGETAKSKKLQAEAAARAFDEAGAGVHRVRLCHELTRAYLRWFELTDENSRLATKASKVQNLRTELAEVANRLAELPEVDGTKLKLLNKLEGKCSVAGAALEAMAAGLEVLECSEPVSAGQTALTPGQVQILTEDTEVRIGSGVRLLVKPGGGRSLAEARHAVQDAQRELQKALDKLGVSTVAVAADVSARRMGMDQRIGEIRASLEGLGAEDIESEISASERAMSSARADVDRIGALVSEFTAPANLAEAIALDISRRDELHKAEALERSLKTERDAALQGQMEAETTLEREKAALDKEQREIEGQKAQLKVLLQTHGDDGPREQKLQEYSQANSKARDALGVTKAALEELQPELLEGRKRRCDRALVETQRQLAEWGSKLAVARNTLVSDGVTDPKGALAEAGARARSAEAHCRTVERRARAIQLLHRLFLEEQRNLADQFTRPLAEAISRYLQCLFGPDARAVVTLEDNVFSGMEIARPSQGFGGFGFETLSGGTKEQLAAAVRLAMAEVLASDHQGCLPLVFDDAFAFSDPQRVKTLQGMLDFAAERGLQIIILTCNPADYTMLGAKQTLLEPAKSRIPSQLPTHIAKSADQAGSVIRSS